MGEALRNTTLVSRPSDMFFQPSASPAAPVDGRDAGRPPAREDAPGPSSDPAGPTGAEAGEQGKNVPADTASPADRVSRETRSSSRPPSSARPSAQGRRPAADDAAASTSDTADRVARETTAEADGLATVPGATFAEIAVAAIHPNRKQPRQVFDEEELAELAYSIGELGVLQPIVVRPSREDGGTSYELVMGERRWRATQRAGLGTIPAIIRETSDDDLLRDALLENLHRSQLNPLEEAAAYQQLLEEFGATQEELSRRIGRSRPQISNTIRLLRLPPLVQRRVAAGVLSSGHARALLSLADPAEMERLAQRIVAEGLSVRATEEAVALTEGTDRKAPRAAAPAGRHKERLDYIAEAFADRLDTSVKIALGARKGKMTIEFASVEDLNRIIEVLDPGIERS
ncbi:ParB/RepB/Spo0J family partition protein [Kocuria sp. KH4]